MRRALVAALAREGVPLEAVYRIVQATFGGDLPLDISGFEPQLHGDYTIACERFADTLPELHSLHLEHWQETEKYRHGIAMDPDYEAIKERERVGGVLQVTVRDRNRVLVGQTRMYVGKSLHTSQLHAQEDTLFLRPAHRGGYLAVRMVRYTERCLVALGVRSIECNSKLSNNAGVLMRRLGFEPFATQFSKIIGVQEAAPHLQEGDAAREHAP